MEASHLPFGKKEQINTTETFNHIMIPKQLSPQETLEELIRMTKISQEEYSQHVYECGIKFIDLVVRELVFDEAFANELAEEISRQESFWLFFKNQVYLKTKQFIYDFYDIDDSVNGYKMKKQCWFDRLLPQRIIARPSARQVKECMQRIIRDCIIPRKEAEAA